HRPETIVLLGIRPSDPDTGYGWIEPGDAVDPGRLCRVRRFVEKPSLSQAQKMFRAGWLWNTLVLVAKITQLLTIALPHVPDTVEPLLEIRETVETPYEAGAIRRAYAAAIPANLSRDLLERAHEALSVLDVSDVVWSDWGTPERVLATLEHLGQ